MAAITLRGMKLSGHVHRVRLLLGLLELPYDYVETTADDRAAAEFRALNPLGQVPVLTDGEVALADSNAILVYLARRYAPDSGWLPTEPVAAAKVQRWLSIAAGELRYGPAMARSIAVFKRQIDPAPAIALAETLFAFMDACLRQGEPFLAAGRPTLADLACYAYTARAPEGGVSIEPYAAIRAWLARVEALPRFTPMPRATGPCA
jgi:glutathione S-transferase